MAQAGFSLYTNQLITNAAITGNGVFDVLVGANQTNSLALAGLRLVLDYSQEVPADGGATPITWALGALAEVQNGAAWFPVAYQFEQFANPAQGRKRVVMLAPNISTFDAGIDDVMYVGGETIARISRQQGMLGSTWRLRVVCRESGFGGAGAFQSARLSAYGEMFDASL